MEDDGRAPDSGEQWLEVAAHVHGEFAYLWGGHARGRGADVDRADLGTARLDKREAQFTADVAGAARDDGDGALQGRPAAAASAAAWGG